MDDTQIDRAAMGRLASALVFIKGAKDPTAIALKAACDSGTPGDIKKARLLFVKLRPGDRQAALAMLGDGEEP